MPKETVLFDNDFTAYCDAFADDYPDHVLHDLFPSFPNIDDDVRDCLEAVEMDEEDIDAFLENTSEMEDDEAYELLAEKRGEVMEEKGTKKEFKDKVFDIMTSDATGFFSDEFVRDNTEFFKSGCDMLGIQPDEDCLVMGTDIGWRNLDGFMVLEPDSEGTIAESILQSQRTDMHLRITHEEGAPYLSATAYTHDSPTGESYTIVPASWARKAFESKVLHDDLNNLLMASDDVRDFLYENSAVPELEKDPVAYGLMKGTVNHATACYNPANMKAHVQKTAKQLAQFRFGDFETYCREQGACCTPMQPYDDPYSTAETLQDYMEDYFYTMKEGKETALSKGLEKLLLSEDGSKAIPKLKGYLKGKQSVIAELKRLGREDAR